MPEIPQGYRDIPEEDRKKAQTFFDRGRTVADTGNYDYAIEMYLQGLNMDPDAIEAHQALREISLKRKAMGGKDLGLFEKLKFKRPGKDDKESLQKAEKLLAYDPGNTDHMLNIFQLAYKCGFYDTVMWMGPLLQKANTDSKSPDYNKFIALRDIYCELKQWKLATDACQLAARLRPDDMDMQTTLKNLGARETMDDGGYEAGGSFRNSIRDAKAQHRLLQEDSGVRTSDSLTRAIMEAEEQYKADPNEPGKLMKLVEALIRTESMENENRAIELLSDTYQRTRQFRFRLHIGKIKIAQLRRQERAQRMALQADPTNPTLRSDYAQFLREKYEEELKEFTLFSENYPTDNGYRFEMAVRLFHLERYNEAIPLFQQTRTDPKLRTDAAVFLGRAFLQMNYIDEAVDTFRAVIDDYQLRGDAKSKEMYYWFGHALEQKNDTPAAIKSYSQVAQWDFNYRDVQERIKRLRSTGLSGA